MFFAKIMQIECRTTSLLDCYAEMQLILCKDTFFPHTIQIFVSRFAGNGLHRNGRCRLFLNTNISNLTNHSSLSLRLLVSF